MFSKEIAKSATDNSQCPFPLFPQLLFGQEKKAAKYAYFGRNVYF